jgi:rhodanese-related sulfurtransferase
VSTDRERTGRRPTRPGRATRLITAGVAALGASLGCVPTADAQESAKLGRIRDMVEEYRVDFPDAPGVGVEQVSAWHAANEVVFVDVRSAEERAVSMLPGAITAEAFQRAPTRYEGRRVVAYCTIGYRSARFAERMIRAGYPVFNFDGSILAWTHAGLPLESPEGPTTRLHVYGRRWDLAADGYTTVW